MPAVIQVKRGTASCWTSANTVLAAGEIGFETDTKKFKVGDGSTAWTSLGYTTVDLVSAALTGTPTAPTASANTNTTQIATTAFVRTEVSNLVASAPAALDTLNELATALGNDASFSTTVTNSLATKASLTGTETLTNKTLTAPKVNLTFNAQVGTTYTFVLGDNGQMISANNASAQTYTIPPNSSVAFPDGTQINVIQIGAGQVTFAQGSGVTIVSTGATSGAPKLRAQYSSATLIKRSTDLWYVVGDIS